MGMASADPQKLEDAAAAVPAVVTQALEQAVTHGGLAAKINQFAQYTQDPFRVRVDSGELVGALASASTKGNELDNRLVRIAAEFRRAGGSRPVPWGWQGPVVPGASAVSPAPNTRYMDDAALRGGLNEWGRNHGLQFRKREDEKVEMRGPDGNPYLVVGSPPQGTPPVGSNEGAIDFTNPVAGVSISMAVVNGALGGTTDPFIYAPREAYNHVQLDPNGIPIIGPNAGDHSQPLPRPVAGLAKPGDVNQPLPRPNPDEEPTVPWRKGEQALPWRSSSAPGWWRGPSEAPPGLRWEPIPGTRDPLNTPRGRRAAGIALVGALAEAAKHTNVRNKNIFRARTTFYVDPRTGQRVAVVDVASITYEKRDDDGDPATDPRQHVVVRWGRLTTDELGRPTVVAHPANPEPFSEAGIQRFPIEEGD
jgi:hypothetical protein